MRFLYTYFFILFFICPTLGQTKLDRTLRKFNKESVPYVYVSEVSDLEGVLLLDTRKKKEFEVSHLKNALWVGHKEFNQDSITSAIGNKDREIIVYCSIGVRSENIGEKLMKAGYTNVKNMYGGIFEWKNNGNKVYAPNGVETDSVHAFDKHWGKLLKKGVKVYNVPKDDRKERREKSSQ